jgi:hypothetical protein
VGAGASVIVAVQSAMTRQVWPHEMSPGRMLWMLFAAG